MLWFTVLRSSLPGPSLALELYDRLDGLPSPSMAANRLRLPGIVLRLTQVDHISGPDSKTVPGVYRAMSSTLGSVEIRTTENLHEANSLCLVHPWIFPLLDQEFSDGAEALDRTTQALRLVARLRQPFGALLFAQLSRMEYRRVATDSLIMVRVREDAPLTDWIENIRTIEVV